MTDGKNPLENEERVKNALDTLKVIHKLRGATPDPIVDYLELLANIADDAHHMRSESLKSLLPQLDLRTERLIGFLFTPPKATT